MLGCLSLHLNQRQFGTLPIGIFCQIWTQDTSGQFLNLSIFGDSRAISVFFQKWVPSKNQIFLNKGVTSLSYIFLVQGGQITRLYDGTILGGV